MKCRNCEKELQGYPNVCPHCNFYFAELRVLTEEEMIQKGFVAEVQIREEQRRRQKEEEVKAAQEREKYAEIFALNPEYEYDSVFLYDRHGVVSNSELNLTLAEYAKKGWRLHTIFTNEAGKNSTSFGFGGISSGTNETVDVTILVFERCIAPARKNQTRE